MKSFCGISFSPCVAFAVSLAMVASAALHAQTTLSFVPGVTRVVGTGSAGSTGIGGPALSANINGPRGLVQDAAGNLYLSDQANNVVDRIDAVTGVLTVYAGGGTVCGGATDSAGDGCLATDAKLKSPDQLTLDSAGNLYIADYGDGLVREVVAATGMIVKIAGGGTSGSGMCTGSTDTLGDGCLATAAFVDQPQSVAIDNAGNIYYAESAKKLVRKIDATTGIITKFAGTGTQGNTGDGGVATSAKIGNPAGLYIDSKGNLYFADQTFSLIRKVNLTTKIITTVAGTNNGAGTAVSGYTGDGGPATSATLNTPTDMVVGSDGNLYIADYGNNVIRMVNAAGMISTYIGVGTPCAGGDSLGNGCAINQVKFAGPYVLLPESSGGFLLADYSNNEVRSIALGNEFGTVAANASTGSVRESFIATTSATTIASEKISGTTEFTAGQPSGCTLGAQLSAEASCGLNVTFLPKFSGVRAAPLVLVDADNNSYSEGLRGVGVGAEVDFSAGPISTFAGTGTAGSTNGASTAAQFSGNSSVVVDSGDNLYVADTLNNKIRLVANGSVTTVAGTGMAGNTGDGGVATSALLNAPEGMVLDVAGGRLLIADTGNNTVRALSPSGILTTIAGTGSAAYTGDGAAATAAALSAPAGVAADYAGNIYIADTGNNVVREITPGGIISTIAGTGAQGFSGDGAAATAAELNAPAGVAADMQGNLYIADTGNHTIRRVVLSTGIITTVAGTGASGYTGDNGVGISATLNHPKSLSTDPAGGLYIADTGNHALRFLSVAGTITTVAGTGMSGYSGDGSVATTAQLDAPEGVALNSAGDIFISDTGNNVVREISRASSPTVTFSQQAVGTTSAAQTVTLFNTGNEALSITSVAATAPFAMAAAAGSCAAGTAVSAGGSCTLSVTFTPTSTGSTSGTLTIQDNALGSSSTQILPLTFTNPGEDTTTSLTITPAASPLAYGTSVTLTATVSAQASNTSAFTGSVIFSDGSTQLNTVAVGANGTAMLTIIPGVGSHSYSAYFLGDSGHGLSQSASTAVVIQQASTTTTLTAISASAQLDTSVTLTATVAPQVSGTPSGSVTFRSAAGTLSSVQLVNGVATLTLTTLPAGTNTITAVYSGDTNFEASTSNNASVTITTTPDFTFTATPSAITISAGQSGIVVLTITPQFNYSGTLTFSCGTLPANVSCRFLPTSLTAAGDNEVLSGQLLITTGGTSAVQAAGYTQTICVLGLMAFMGLLFTRQRKLRFGMLAMMLAVAMLDTLSGCSSSATPSPEAASGSSTIAITATGSSGSVTHVDNVTLNIQ